MQTTTQLAATNVFLQKDFLSRNVPLYVFGRYIKKVPLPTRNSGTVEFSRVELLPPLMGAQLSTSKTYIEGITPNDTSMVWTKIQVVTNLFANLMRTAEQVDLTVDRALLSEMMKVNAENKNQVEELILSTALASGSQAHLYSDSIGGIAGAARVNVIGLVNPDAMDAAIALFAGGSTTVGPTPKFTKAIKASANFNTTPIPPCWIGFCHPHVSKDLRRMPGFIRVEHYNGELDNEIGYYGSVRWIETTLCKLYPDAGAAVAGTRSTTGTNSDVYASYIIGPDAVASVTLESGTEMIFISHKQIDNAQPLGLVDTVGWKMRTGAGVIDQTRILRLETCAST